MSDNQITLYTLGGAFGMESVSPFCFKLELLIKHLGIDAQVIVQPDPRKAPKGKMPYAQINGEVIADSELVMNRLDELTQGKVFGTLSAADQAKGFALTRVAEEHLYWQIVASRWLDDDWWPNVVEGFFATVPGLVRPVVTSLARRQVRQTYQLQGLGRHSHDEQVMFARRDLQTLQDSITDQGFLLGAEVTVFDFAIAAIMTGLLENRPKTWLTPIGEEYQGLIDYTERVQNAVGLYATARDEI